MDNETLMKMFLNMMNTMSDSEVEAALNKAKTLLSVKDYDKLLQLVEEKRNYKND